MDAFSHLISFAYVDRFSQIFKFPAGDLSSDYIQYILVTIKHIHYATYTIKIVSLIACLPGGSQ